MSEQTEIITKPTREEPAGSGSSHFLQISIRAWLAVLLISTVCAHSAATIALAIIMKNPDLLKVTEPLYTMSGMALAYYFGQQKQQPNKQQQ